MPRTLKTCLLEQALPPQIDFLLYALTRLELTGDETPIPDEIAAEVRRVFADIRRLLATTPLRLADPPKPLFGGPLNVALREALITLVLFAEHERQRHITARRKERDLEQMEGSARAPRPLAVLD